MLTNAATSLPSPRGILRKLLVESLDSSAIVLCAGIFAIFLFLVFRNVGLFPVVFGDEYLYSMSSRHVHLAASQVSAYIYLVVFRCTNFSGDGFLECARLLNTFFFLSAGPFIYLTARQVASKRLAVFVTLCALVGPTNSYTAYFMPEATYFLAFWCLTWFILAHRDTNSSYYGSIIGVLVAIMAMIKVNVLFLLPGIILFLIYSAFCSSLSAPLKRSAVTVVWLLVAFVATRLAVGYLLAGHAGLDILGAKYGGLASSELTLREAARLAGQMFFVLRNHVIALALLFGVPLISLVDIRPQEAVPSQAGNNLFMLRAYTIVILASLLLVTAYYTAAVGAQGELTNRVHMRYYTFALPLLFMLAAGDLAANSRKLNSYVAWLAAVLVAGSAIISYRYLPTFCVLTFVDCPELAGFTDNKTIFALLGSLGVLAVLLFALRKDMGLRLFVFVFMPLSLLCSAYSVNGELRRRMVPDEYDRAGRSAHDFLGRQDRARVEIVGSNAAGLYKALFHIDDAAAGFLSLADGAPLDPDKIPSDKEWVLVVGNHRIPPEARVEFANSEYSLLRISSVAPAVVPPQTMNFSRPSGDMLVKRSGGGLSPRIASAHASSLRPFERQDLDAREAEPANLRGLHRLSLADEWERQRDQSEEWLAGPL